jgi:hypothetical protein
MWLMAVASKLSLALILLGSVLFAYLGPPPRRSADVRVRAAMLVTGIAAYGLAAVALAGGALIAGGIAIAVAGELLCMAGWLGRGEAPPSDEDDDGGGGGGGGRGPKPPPSDWDAFERAFRRYARERERQPI